MAVDWLQALDGDCAPADPDRLVAWSRRLGPPMDPELPGSVAVFAREAAAAGFAASRVARIFDVIEPWAGAAARRLRDVAVDAHGLGLLDRRRRQELSTQKKSTPVLMLDGGVVVCLSGPTEATVLDAVLARAFRAAVGAQSPWIVIDVSHSSLQSDLLPRSLADLDRLGLPESIRICVSGLEAPEAFAAQVVRFGGKRRVHPAGRLSDLLVELRTETLLAPPSS